MKIPISRRFGVQRSRGFTFVYLLILFAMLCGFASLAVDWGRVQMVKTQLFRAADAASRAAVDQLPNGITATQNAAVTWAGYNSADGSPVVVDPNNDVEFGTWDPTAKSFTVLTGAYRTNANAVRVTARRTTARGNGVSLGFGSILGASTCNANASVIAARSTSGFGIVGLSSVTTNPGNSTLNYDSWNSSTGTYGAFPMNSNASVASNGNITLASSTVVKGNCKAGKSGTLSGGSVSGSTTNLNYVLNYPAPNPGTAVTVNNNASLPGAYFNSGTRNFTIPSGQTLTLPGGTYYVNNINWDTANITFTGPVVFYISGSTFFTRNNYITTYQNAPANLKFEVIGNAAVTYDFDQSCYAVLYAPLSNVYTHGFADDYGSIVGNNLNMTCGWHVDEALGGVGVTGVALTVR